MNRTVNVVRMQLVNRSTFLWVPLIIVVSAFALSLLIGLVIPSNGVVTGGGQAVFWYFFAVGIISLTYTFPFSQAMSITRREFFLGTLLTSLGIAASLAVIYVAAGAVENATGGWGLNTWYFAPEWLWSAGALTTGLFYLSLSMLFFLVGFSAATLFKRFGSLWLTVALVGIGLVLVGGLWLIGQLDAWEQVGAWLTGITPLSLSLAFLAVAVVLAGASYGMLRRLVP